MTRRTATISGASRLWPGGIVLLLALLTAMPLLVVATPPFFDYPNHLSRAHILAGIDRSQTFADWFDLSTFLIPNVSADLVLTGLSRLVGAEAAGKAFLLGIGWLTLGGAAALGAANAGRLHPWPLLSAVFLFSEMLHWGFLNYLLGLALLLWGLAAWIFLSARSRRLQIAAGAAFALAIFFSHLVAFGLFAIAVAAWELAREFQLWRAAPPAWSRRAAQARLAASAAIFLPPACLYVVLSPSRGLPAAPLFNITLFEKLAPYTRLLSSGDPLGDAALVLAGGGLVGLLIFFRRVTLEPRLAAVAAALWLCQMILPYSALHSFFVDSRIAVAAVLVLLCALRSRPGAWPDRLGWTAAVVLTAVRTILLSQQWTAADREYREILAAFDRLPIGSVLIAATQAHFEYGTGWFFTRRVNPPHEHTASYATIRRDAVVPAIFAKPGQNPLVFAPVSKSLGQIALGPIPRLFVDRQFKQLARRASLVGAELDQAGRPHQPVYIVAFYAKCEEWPPNAPIRPVECGSMFSIVRVERAGADRRIRAQED